MIDGMLYKVNLTDFITWVTPEEARKIELQFTTDCPFILFEDIFGSRNFIPRKDYCGHWETSPSIRATSDEFMTALKEEEKETKPPTWSEE